MVNNSSTATSLKVAFDAVAGAKSYVVHYLDADTDDAHAMIKMGYTESTSWELPDSVHGEPMAGKVFTVAVQSFPVTSTVSGTGVEKARDMIDNHQDGLQSEWSKPLLKVTLPSE